MSKKFLNDLSSLISRVLNEFSIGNKSKFSLKNSPALNLCAYVK